MLSKYLDIIVETNNISLFEENFEEDATIVVNGEKGFEIKNSNILNFKFSRWRIQLFPYNVSDLAKIQTTIMEKQSYLNYNIVKLKLKYQDFKLQIAKEEDLLVDVKDIVLSNNIKNLQNSNKVNIFMNHSLGFGTGKHATTYLCLILLQELLDKNVSNILDVGTGSGVLALCAAKLFNTTVLAIDNDILALDTANKFIHINKLEYKVKTIFSNGFQNIEPQNFNLIMANILLNPLIAMSENFNQFSAKNGYLILSGILKHQSKILQIALQNRWRLVEEVQLEDWSALLLQKQR